MRKTRHTTLSTPVGLYTRMHDAEFMKALEIQQKMLNPPPRPLTLEEEKLRARAKAAYFASNYGSGIRGVPTTIALMDDLSTWATFDLNGVQVPGVSFDGGRTFSFEMGKFGLGSILVRMNVNERRPHDHCGVGRGQASVCGGLERDPRTAELHRAWSDSWRRVADLARAAGGCAE